jgi:hypothetical protein
MAVRAAVFGYAAVRQCAAVRGSARSNVRRCDGSVRHSVWQCEAVRAAMCGSTRAAVCGSVHGSVHVVRAAVCASALGSFGSARSSVAAVRQCGSVRQSAAVRVAVCGSKGSSVRQCVAA